MFGITDPGIYWAYLLVFLCVIGAVIFGILYWNKGGDITEEELANDLEWEEKEKKIKAEEA
ncbi:MAG: symporter small accessory protein [Prolixibacteraceae bacterium]